MEIFPWKVEYNLGIDVIDSQHQQIVNYINELSYAINRGDNDEVYEVLEKLKDYCLDHFDFEEQLMQQAGYILLEAHQGVHRRFKERVDNIQEELLQGKDPMRSEEHTSELQSRPHLVCRLLLEKKKKKIQKQTEKLITIENNK